MTIRAGDEVEYLGQRHRVLTEISDDEIALPGNPVIRVHPKQVRFIRRDWVSASPSRWLKLPTAERVRQVRRIVGEHSDIFRDGFANTITANMHVFEAALEQAIQVRHAGRDRWSMRTIMEYLRHETAVQSSLLPWKLNNNLAPDVARLMIMLFPEFDGFFELRESPQRKRVAG